jgi:polar amino acid transport system substrate-binding protein
MTHRIRNSLLALVGVCAASAMAATEVRTAAQDSQPKFVKTGAAMSGLCIDVFKAIERVEPDLKFSDMKDFTPLARIEASMAEGELDVFCGLAKTATRQAQLDFIETPIYTTHSVLAARMDDKTDIKTFDDIRKLGENGVLLVVTKTVHAEVLAAQGGLKVDAGAKDTSVNLKKLLDGKGRFIYHNDFALVDEIKRDNLGDKVKLLPAQFATEGRFMVLSKKAAPAIKVKLTAAIEKLSKSGELAKIFLVYKPK